ncbi:AIM24 family protein [Nocardioides solisilvae]|uniref:AIM24 family protein n=1 Tax=Nocardioides solisilvae TaxID=1542435 RepID=UPI000D74E1A5|nr:AIM24 family protein [Nocardioides solisilvae]
MRSELFSRVHEEVSTPEALALQNGYLLKATLGPPVVATKGSMVAYQGDVAFEHKSAGSLGKLIKRAVTSEDTPLMTVTGRGEVFLADRGRNVFLVDLEGPQDALSISGTSLLAFESSLEHDVHRVKGAGMLAAGAFNTLVRGRGRVALTCHGTPLILDCSRQPTFVDMNAVVCWSASLQPTVQSSMNVRSLLRGGTGEAFQYAFHGPGFVVVQPSEGDPQAPTDGSSKGSGGFLGDVFGG